ncbi:MAG: ATP-binding protein [Rubripirellula sp.]
MKRSTNQGKPSTHETSVDTGARTHQGSLRSKLVLSLGAMFFVFLTIDEMVRQQVIQPEFVALERSGGIRDANRVLAAMNAEVEHLNDLALHWASRIDDGTVERPSSFIRSEEESGSWATRKLDWAAYIAATGDWKWMRRNTDVSVNDVQMQFESLVEVCRSSHHRSFSGMTRIGDQSLVMISIVGLDAAAKSPHPPNGRFLIVARRIDETLVTTLRRQTQVEFSLQSPRTSNPAQKLIVWEANESTMIVEIQLTGIHDQKLANVFIRVPRDITARSKRTTLLARNSFIFGSVAALLMLLLLLQRIVISPLTRIREHSQRIAEHGLATERLALTRNDEIGHLAGAFDQMLGRLGDAQTQLATASRAAGRSQVASTVIHNVGNVLTNVNSLLDAACGRVHKLRIQPLDRLASRLKQDDVDAGLLAATPDYLEGLAGSLKCEQDSIGELLETLHDNIRHIHDVIRDQQRHADQTIKPKQIQLSEVIDEAIACCSARLEEDDVRVRITGDVDADVHADRSLLLQTMINIIGNARNAMRESAGVETRRLLIDVTEGERSTSIQFRDNGCGMTQSTLRKIFDAHFTTRESGTGLGLHFCALTLKRLGGSITAESEGIGKGSTFVVEVPRCSAPLRAETSTASLLSGTQAQP